MIKWAIEIIEIEAKNGEKSTTLNILYGIVERDLDHLADLIQVKKFDEARDFMDALTDGYCEDWIHHPDYSNCNKENDFAFPAGYMYVRVIDEYHCGKIIGLLESNHPEKILQKAGIF